MRWLTCSFLLLLGGPPAQDPASPVDGMERFDLEVKHWEGSFGSYLSPGPGWVVTLDLGAIGEKGLVTVRPAGEGIDEGLVGRFDLAFLEPTSDKVEGDATHGWTRRVVLKGRRRPHFEEQTVLELVIQYVVERYDVSDDRRGKVTSNTTHVSFRIHTLRDDDTIREYGRATSYHDRDAGLRIPAPVEKR